MPRSRAPKKPKQEPEPEVVVEAAAEPADVQAAGDSHPAVSKAQAVRDALAEGVEGVGDIEEFVRSRYGMEISRQMISAYKSQARSKQGGAKRNPEAESAVASRRSSRRGGDADLIEALEAMKPLVAALGADAVKRLVDLLG